MMDELICNMRCQICGTEKSFASAESAEARGWKRALGHSDRWACSECVAKMFAGVTRKEARQ